MRLSACITTRNRPQKLESCLSAIWASTVKPHSVIVSDDSLDPDMQQTNRQIVERYSPNTIYLTGPRNGVCGNRNNAVNAVMDSELVAFVDDDIYVSPNFVELALDCYARSPVEERDRTIFTGVSEAEAGMQMLPGKLTFRGYFRPEARHPETVVIHATIFPRTFFEQEQWDEDIFFGYEDAELCLRAIKRGYKIISAPQLRVTNGGDLQGSLITPAIGNLTDYEIYVEAARLYVGIKRYKHLFPNLLKLALFVIIYFAHMTIYLIRKKSLNAFPEIIRRSHIDRL
jgi:GT2 family glycosyltransferase